MESKVVRIKDFKGIDIKIKFYLIFHSQNIFYKFFTSQKKKIFTNIAFIHLEMDESEYY